jgi:hypothetical protein
VISGSLLVREMAAKAAGVQERLPIAFSLAIVRHAFGSEPSSLGPELAVRIRG